MSQQPLEHRHLRSALEYAVLMAREGQKFKPPMAYPAGLKKHMAAPRVLASALPTLRRLVDGDDTFRGRIAAGAIPELVDPIGQLWLKRPEGWEQQVEALVFEVEEDARQVDAARQLKKAEKRREAAEQATARSRAEIVLLTDEVARRDVAIDELRADIDKLSEALAEVRAELTDTRLEARHARDREAAALQRLTAAEQQRDEARVAAGAAEHVRDDVLADRASVAAERSELARLAAHASALAEQLAAVAAPPKAGKVEPARRKPLAMPGGVLGDSDLAAEFLMRSGASVLIDGYNVAKLAWPKLDLAGQRVVLLDAIENLARRYGSDITVVFDGANVIGAAAEGRRIVRVVFSPADVIADDVIRDEVRRLPATRHVVVVTNDNEIINDTRSMGANTMSSDRLIALMK